MSQVTMEEFVRTFIDNSEQLFSMRNYGELRDLCEEFLTEHIDERIYSILSAAYFAMGAYKEAEKAARAGYAINPQNPDHAYNLACISKEIGRFQNAWRFYNRAQLRADEELQEICINEKQTIEQQLGVTHEVICPQKQSKRVLVIAAIYPPESGSGVQRTVKLVKYLRHFGWEPVVVTLEIKKPHMSGYEYFDELPDDIEVIRMPINTYVTVPLLEKVKNTMLSMLSVKTRREFEHAYSKADVQMKVNLCSFPETIAFWAHNVAEKINEFVDMSRISAVYSTSGPYSNHVAGLLIRQCFSIPWIADFRDEWSNNPAIWPNKRTLQYQMCVDAEQFIFKNADQVICVTELGYENYLELGVSKDKLTCITNGYDEEDFSNMMVDTFANEQFSLVHNGVLYMDRTPYPVLDALKNLIKKKEIDENKIVFHIGSIVEEELEKEVSSIIKEYHLENVVRMTPYMEHAQSISFSAKADMLIVLLGASEKYRGSYTGKIFEYLRLGKWIVSLGPKGSLVQKLLEKTGQGKNIVFQDVGAIEQEILQRYQAWNSGEQLQQRSSTNIEEYERKNLTQKHAEIFQKALTSSLKTFRDKHPGVTVIVHNTAAFPKDGLSKNEQMIVEKRTDMVMPVQ